MPKGKRKDRQPRRREEVQSEEELDASDTTSVISSQSDIQDASAEGVEPEVDEAASQEDFEDRLKECIDGLGQKSAKGRVESLKSLGMALSKKVLSEFIADRKMTILDALERNLKKGKGEEQAEAAQCAVLLCLQLGAGVDGTEVYSTLRPTLRTIMIDGSASLKARAACAFSLGSLTFLANDDLTETFEVMKSLESVFKTSYFKGDKSVPNHSPEVCVLHSSAISAWALLISILPSSMFNTILSSHLGKLPQLLESADVDVRIVAGETLALLYEMAREEDETFEGDDIDELCLKLKQLATDSNKYRAKKDRRQQRSSFRDVLKAVEDGEQPSCRIRFGTEAIDVDSWAKKRHYDALCQALGIGIQIHLQENELVREIFGLGAPIPAAAQNGRTFSKRERHHYNSEAFKARTKARAKHRDKRSAVLHNGS